MNSKTLKTQDSRLKTCIQDITFCIKTVHRPWSCDRLVKSLFDQFGHPDIVVVDDGLDGRRFSQLYPATAGHCLVIDLPEHDVGVGVGRNAAIDAAQTEFIFLLDDDHIVDERLQLESVYHRFHEHSIDILGVRQGEGGRPLMLSPLMNGKRIWMHRGEYRAVGQVAWCDMASNAFLARRDTIAKLRWDSELKTYEHWEFFYRASRIEKLQVAVATDCHIRHAHIETKDYGHLRFRAKYRKLGLRKHGFHSMRYPGGAIVHA